MTKFPDLKIGSHKIKVRTSTNRQDGMLGMYSHHNKQIQLFPMEDSLESVDLQVYMHEVIHALEDIYVGGLGTLEEHEVDQLAEGFCQIMTDNPKLRRLFGD